MILFSFLVLGVYKTDVGADTVYFVPKKSQTAVNDFPVSIQPEVFDKLDVTCNVR
jgi:hypothetical protein